MKYSNYIGIFAALLLIFSCFIPWAYYPDLDKTFNGFFSEQNNYGKPGKLLLFFAIVSITMFVLPQIWAKRFNQFIGIILLAFAIKSFILFTSCYKGICPDKKAGIYIMLSSTVLILLCALLAIDKKTVKKDQ